MSTPSIIDQRRREEDEQASREPAENKGGQVVRTLNDLGNAKLVQLQTGGEGLLFGYRIPKDYYLAQGWGDTNDGGGIDPWETGSYDLALEMAGIHNFNVVSYTSCIPAEATEVQLSDVQHNFHHGAVLECIISVMHGSQGDRISAGVGSFKVRRKKDGHVHGGWAAEYKGHAGAEGVKKVLDSDMKGIFERRFGGDAYEMIDVKHIIEVHEVENSYGTVLAAYCFVSWIVPLLSPASK